MSPDSFQYLLNVVGPATTKKDTRFQKAISPAERLCLRIHYLAYGDSQQSLFFSYRIGRSTISGIINETCAIWGTLKDEYVRSPRTSKAWKSIAKDFQEMWNLPHFIGAIDSEHGAIKSLLYSCSSYFNYKGYFIIVLMAIFDALYVFTYIDIGSNNDSCVN